MSFSIECFLYRKPNIIYPFCRHRVLMLLRDMINHVQSPEGVVRVEMDNMHGRDWLDSIPDAWNFVEAFPTEASKREYTKHMTATRAQVLKMIANNNGDLSSWLNTAGYLQGCNDLAAHNCGRAPKMPNIMSDNLANLEEDEVDAVLTKNCTCLPSIKIEESNFSEDIDDDDCPLDADSIDAWNAGSQVRRLSISREAADLSNFSDEAYPDSFEDLQSKLVNGCSCRIHWSDTDIVLNQLMNFRQHEQHTNDVYFESTDMLERFIDYWRVTGQQRVGILYGVHEAHPDNNFGTRSRVVSIYEPPQKTTRDIVKLLHDSSQVDEVADRLGLQKIGWIFTDLLVEDASYESVKNQREDYTYPLTEEECLMSDYLQKQMQQGVDGVDRFVTLCVSGDASNRISVTGYTVTERCATPAVGSQRNSPGLEYLRENSDSHSSRSTSPCNNNVNYCLKEVPVCLTSALHQSIAPRQLWQRYFPIENRQNMTGHKQTFDALTEYLAHWAHDDFLHAISDFHLLVYLAQMTDLLPTQQGFDVLLEAVRRNGDYSHFFRRSDSMREGDQCISLQNIIAKQSANTLM